MIEQYVDTEELKRLGSGLLVFLGALIIAVLFASIVIPGLRNANKPAAAMPVTPVLGEPGWLDPTEFPPQREKQIPAVDARTLITASPQLLERGNALYERNCTQCHGSRGKGDGPAASTLNPRPRNLTIADGWTRGYGLPALYETITVGIKGTGMQAFDYIPKADRMAMAHYVQKLGAWDRAGADPATMEALAKQLSSAGEIIPARIPVSMAMVRMQEEYAAPLALPQEILNQEIVRRVVADPERAAKTLAASPSWRKGPDELAAFITSGAPANGFAVKSAALTPNEWQTMFAELSKYDDK